DSAAHTDEPTADSGRRTAHASGTSGSVARTHVVEVRRRGQDRDRIVRPSPSRLPWRTVARQGAIDRSARTRLRHRRREAEALTTALTERGRRVDHDGRRAAAPDDDARQLERQDARLE